MISRRPLKSGATPAAAPASRSATVRPRGGRGRRALGRRRARGSLTARNESDRGRACRKGPAPLAFGCERDKLLARGRNRPDLGVNSILTNFREKIVNFFFTIGSPMAPRLPVSGLRRFLFFPAATAAYLQARIATCGYDRETVEEIAKSAHPNGNFGE
jgi:hypothetical protein